MVLVVGAFGCNITQELANFNVLFSEQARPRDVVFVSPENAVLALAPGSHVVRARRRYKCGLIPLGAPCEHATTRGLRWELAGEPLSFGGLISSSNEMLTTTVHVAVTSTVLWTFDLDRPLD